MARRVENVPTKKALRRDPVEEIMREMLESKRSSGMESGTSVEVIVL